MRPGSVVHKALHRRRALLHGRQVSANRVRLRMVCVFRGVITFIATAVFLRAALLFGSPGIIHAPFIKAPSFRRVPAVWLQPGRCRRTAVTDVFHARARLVGRRLFRFSVILPLTHPLGANRGRTVVVHPMERIIGKARLRCRGHSRFRTTWTRLLSMCRVGRRLMLRIRRLGGRHAVFMHGRSTVIPRAASAVRHQRIGRRSTGARSRARLEHRGRRVAHIVRVPDSKRL